jgi:hypothetical protein
VGNREVKRNPLAKRDALTELRNREPSRRRATDEMPPDFRGKLRREILRARLGNSLANRFEHDASDALGIAARCKLRSVLNRSDELVVPHLGLSCGSGAHSWLRVIRCAARR